MRSVFLIVRYVRFGNHPTVVDPASTPCDLDGLCSRTSSSPGEKYRCGGFDEISTSLSPCVSVEPTPTGKQKHTVSTRDVSGSDVASTHE